MNWKLDLTGLIEPISALKYLFKKPMTIEGTSRDAVEGYRGLHINDQARCIGCGLCEDICMNLAIDMVTPEELRNPKNGSGLIPRIDLGRCCWCSLCTDVCPTKSLELSNDYLHVDYDANNFIFDIPDPKHEEKNDE